MAARRANAGRANDANGCRGVLHIARGFSGAETDFNAPRLIDGDILHGPEPRPLLTLPPFAAAR